MDSPFETILAPHRDILPPALKAQYLTPVDAGRTVHFNGTSDRVWHRPRWLWPFFWALAWFDVIFPETGVNIPATMELTSARDRYGLPYQRWNRVFAFARPRRFNAVMAWDVQRRCVAEHFTSMQLLSMVWEISFHAPARLEIVTSTCHINLGPLQIPLQRFFHPHVRVVETALDDETIHVDLTMSHPFLGDIFGYSGTYKVEVASAAGNSHPLDQYGSPTINH